MAPRHQAGAGWVHWRYLLLNEYMSRGTQPSDHPARPVRREALPRFRSSAAACPAQLFVLLALAPACAALRGAPA